MVKKIKSPLSKHVKKGFKGYPIGTIAYYGPDDQRASKLVVSIMESDNDEITDMKKWYSDDTDLRKDLSVHYEILEYIKSYGVKSVAAVDRIIGCPHEEGIDYPDNEVCPKCPFWADRDRFSGDRIQ